LSLPATTLAMLGKLIPRLASNHDGEVIATVRAIRRTLASSGADLHDLCIRLGAARRLDGRLGQERTCCQFRPMSALPPKADA
jgi:hypothetical protein